MPNQGMQAAGRRRYEKCNIPGGYHNGGLWLFICGFYVAAGRFRLAERKRAALTELVRPARESDAAFGFNEWLRAQEGTPRGQDWHTWSAAMYLYAAAAGEQKKTPFLDAVRDWVPKREAGRPKRVAATDPG